MQPGCRAPCLAYTLLQVARIGAHLQECVRLTPLLHLPYAPAVLTGVCACHTPAALASCPCRACLTPLPHTPAMRPCHVPLPCLQECVHLTPLPEEGLGLLGAFAGSEWEAAMDAAVQAGSSGQVAVGGMGSNGSSSSSGSLNGSVEACSASGRARKGGAVAGRADVGPLDFLGRHLPPDVAAAVARGV